MRDEATNSSRHRPVTDSFFVYIWAQPEATQ